MWWKRCWILAWYKYCKGCSEYVERRWSDVASNNTTSGRGVFSRCSSCVAGVGRNTWSVMWGNWKGGEFYDGLYGRPDGSMGSFAWLAVRVLMRLSGWWANKEEVSAYVRTFASIVPVAGFLWFVRADVEKGGESHGLVLRRIRKHAGSFRSDGWLMFGRIWGGGDLWAIIKGRLSCSVEGKGQLFLLLFVIFGGIITRMVCKIYFYGVKYNWYIVLTLWI